MLALIVFIFLAIIGGFIFFRYYLTNREMIRRFKDNNVIVFGRKGKGKDLLFQYVINKRKKEKYSANITYGHEWNELHLKQLNLDPNTYEDLLRDNIKKLEKQPFEDKEDIYISDAGNYFPSQYDYLLHKEYKGAPLYYSLCRHISDNNIHCNAQNLERIWKALREQADTYIHCYKRKKLFFGKCIKVDYVIYDKYETARQEIKPIKTGIRKTLKDQKKIETANNGLCKLGHFYIFKKSINYDTRAFRKIFIKSEEELKAESEVNDKIIGKEENEKTEQKD